MNDIRLVDFRAESLQFDINHQFKPKQGDNLPFSVKLDQRVRMSGKPEQPSFLNVRITVFDDAVNNNYPFEIIADVSGAFLIEGEGAERETVLREQGLVVLIPYVRAMISQLVSLANLPTPVILPPLDPSKMTPITPENQ